MRFARRVARLALGSAIVCAFAACPGLVAADAAGAVPRCSAKDLAVWLDDAPGGAGMSHRVFFIDFANLSTHPCVLSGYPRVVPLDVHGHQVSPPARQNPPTGHTVTLAANGGEASAQIGFTVTGVFTGGCNPKWAAGFRVYPPGDTAARIAPYAIQVCSLMSTVTIGAVTPWKTW
jgi:Domain of unknown function (DUF4232)